MKSTDLEGQMTDSDSDFDAAKIIAERLKDLDKERQRRVLRWVAESLDIGVPVMGSTIAGVHQPTVSASPETPVGERRATNIKTFVESKRPKSDIQFAAVVAYFYRFEAPSDERRDSITAEVLQDATRLASRARFVRPLMTLNNAKKQGYLDSSERGAFQINSVGENLVAMTLPGGGDEPAVRRKSVTKSKRT